jgi:hypothetical protein
VFRLDLREDDGDRLRVLVLEVVGEHHFVDVAELVPHRAAGRTADLFHDVVDAVLAEDLGEETLGALIAADERAGCRDRVGEVDEEALDHARVDRPEIGHRLGDLLDLLVVHHAEDLGGVILAEREDEDRRLLGTGQGTDIFARAHGQSALR